MLSSERENSVSVKPGTHLNKKIDNKIVSVDIE